MSFGSIRWARRPLSLTGLLACVLALVSQLALGGLFLPETPPPDGIAALQAAMVLCEPDAADPGTAPAPAHHRHDGGRVLCPLAIALALPAVIPLADPVLPEPGPAMELRRVQVAQARAPPSQLLTAAYPRGPPVLA